MDIAALIEILIWKFLIGNFTSNEQARGSGAKENLCVLYSQKVQLCKEEIHSSSNNEV